MAAVRKTSRGDIPKALSSSTPVSTSVSLLPEYDDSALAGRVTTLEGSDAGKSVRTIANEELAAQLIPADAQESMDTLTEIAAWIQSHPDDAAAMNAAITKLQAKLLRESRCLYGQYGEYCSS